MTLMPIHKAWLQYLCGSVQTGTMLGSLLCAADSSGSSIEGLCIGSLAMRHPSRPFPAVSCGLGTCLHAAVDSALRVAVLGSQGRQQMAFSTPPPLLQLAPPGPAMLRVWPIQLTQARRPGLPARMRVLPLQRLPWHAPDRMPHRQLRGTGVPAGRRLQPSLKVS